MKELNKTEKTYRIGTVTKAHGTRGELSMNFTDDVWDRVDADYVFLEIDGLKVPFFFEGWRFRDDSVALLKFVDIDTVEEAQKLVGCDVYFPESLTPEPTENDNPSWRHFTGWTLIDKSAGNIGTIAHVDDSTTNILFEIGDKLIPANQAFIEKVDAKERTVYTNLPEGLLEL